MPELPEVETVRLGIEKLVLESTVVAVEVKDSRSLKRHEGGASDFINNLQGKKVLSIVRRGKYLWFELNDDKALVAHLGMSGQLVTEKNQSSPKHSRIAITFTNKNSSEVVVHFNDQRIFGSLFIDKLIDTTDGYTGGHGTSNKLIPSKIKHIARDLLDTNISFSDNCEMIFSRINKSKSQIKKVLLDQKIISGIGNIYADEALWKTKIHPESNVSRISNDDLLALLLNSKNILQNSLLHGGTSFDYQYVNVNGESGKFTDNLNVYMREGKTCKRCGNNIIKKKFMNRYSRLCKLCQVLY